MDDGWPSGDADTNGPGAPAQWFAGRAPGYWPTDSLPNDVAASPYQFEPPTPAGMGSKKTLVIVATTMVLIAGVIGLVVVKLGSSGSPNIQATVAASVNHAFASKTASLTITTDIRAGSSEVTATGPGAIDFTRGALYATVDMHTGSQSLPVTLIYLGGTIYEKIPGIDQIEPGKSWITMDLSGMAKADTGAIGGGSNPAAMLALLTQRGAVVTPMGRTTIGGVAVSSYQVTISQAMIEQELNSSNLPAWMRAAAGHASFSDATETVYIDHANQLRRFVTDMTATVNGQSESVNETMDLSNYGVPVVITAPPPSESIGFDQFLKDVQSGLSEF
jgi:hypothetical protein